MSTPSDSPAQPADDPGLALDPLVAAVRGPEDQRGLLDLWHAVLELPHWWFLLVPSEGGIDGAGTADGSAGSTTTSPALATIEGFPMLLAFSSSARARGFAVAHGMVSAGDPVEASALTPSECLDDAEGWSAQGVHSLMFDVHVTGFAIPLDQLPTIAAAVAEDNDADAPGRDGTGER